MRKPALATAATLAAILAVVGPVFTVMIEIQRRRLVQLSDEKDNLIDRYANDLKQDADTIDQLKGQLDVWEGRANPWELWPPVRNTTPRQRLLGDLYDARYAIFDQRRKQNSWTPRQQACGLLALAMLAEDANQPAVARQRFTEASEILLGLVEQRPGDVSAMRALADCYERLARLSDQPDERNRGLAEASNIHEQLASADAAAAKHRADLFDTEFRLASAVGFESAAAHLSRVNQVRVQLAANWPEDPVQLYDLVCHLSQQEAILLGAAPQAD
jgi:hypothetical protein